MISAGILPSGFCLRIVSLASVGSAFSIMTSLSRPRMPIASLILRPNGEGGEERRIIMWGILEGARRAAMAVVNGKKGWTSACDDEFNGFRAFALFFRFDTEA